MTQTALAAALDLTKVAIARFLDRMEVAGLILRRADDDDARLRRVFLTRAGYRCVRLIRRQVEFVEKELHGATTQEQIEETVYTLGRMKEALLQKLAEADVTEVEEVDQHCATSARIEPSE